MKKRLLLVDDHPIIRAGISYLTESEEDLEICGQASSAREASEMVARMLPDLVILDLSMPGKCGLELLKDLRITHPHLPVLVLSMHDELLYGQRSLKAGARGYVMKEDTGHCLAKAIRAVLAGKIYLSAELNSAIVKNSSRGATSGGTLIDRLSDRELEVFELIGRGIASEVIAKDLSISVRTIDAHKANIRKKLGIPDSTALLRFAVRWVETGTWNPP